MTLSDFQRWLNAHGARLKVDGLAGPATRAAVLSVFANPKAKAVTPADVNTLASRICISPQQLAAIATVESGGAGYGPTGLPKILWERHWFWRKTAGRFGLTGYSNPNPGGYTLDADKNGINDSWEKLAAAAMRDPLRAFECCSWGKFQIMGFHAASIGFANAVEMAWAMRESEAAHYAALAGFIQANGLLGPARRLSTNPETCRDFAKGYNGAGYRKFAYHEKLARAMR